MIFASRATSIPCATGDPPLRLTRLVVFLWDQGVTTESEVDRYLLETTGLTNRKYETLSKYKRDFILQKIVINFFRGKYPSTAYDVDALKDLCQRIGANPENLGLYLVQDTQLKTLAEFSALEWTKQAEVYRQLKSGLIRRFGLSL